jgi:hypothetical protein
VDKCGKARQAIGNMIRRRINKDTNTHSQGVVRIAVPMATMVTRTGLNATFISTLPVLLNDVQSTSQTMLIHSDW